MSHITYLFKRVLALNFRQMNEKIREVRCKSSKSRIFIFFDMIRCGVKYQAGYSDYALFEMYNLNEAQRKTVVTRGINNSFIKRFNNPVFAEVFEDKSKFNDRFSDFLGRDFVCVDSHSYEDIKSFLRKHNEFFAKPAGGMCGKGIEKLRLSEFDDINELMEYLREKELAVLEEPVSQHNELMRLHPNSVNTIRVITLNVKGDVKVVAAYLRIGNGAVVDNFNSGGMVVPVDEDRGEVIYPALCKNGEVFDVHPITSVAIKGFRVPMWEDVLSLAKKAGAVVPEVGLVGWDIAVTRGGAVLIEGNDFPGHDIYGLPPHRTDGIGILPKFEKAINGTNR